MRNKNALPVWTLTAEGLPDNQAGSAPQLLSNCRENAPLHCSLPLANDCGLGVKCSGRQQCRERPLQASARETSVQSVGRLERKRERGEGRGGEGLVRAKRVG